MKNMHRNCFSLIASDIRAKAAWVYGDVSSKTILKTLCTDGTFAMICYRFMQAAQRMKLAPLAMLFNKLNLLFGGCIIGRGADFGPGFVLIHSLGVVINSTVKGGANVKLEHQVTIGAEKGHSPVLGDDVFVGAGAKIIGGVKIGHHVKIGANAVVLDDVPDDSVAVGVPARSRGPGGVNGGFKVKEVQSAKFKVQEVQGGGSSRSSRGGKFKKCKVKEVQSAMSAKGTWTESLLNRII